jgi:hypothetical protein
MSDWTADLQITDLRQPVHTEASTGTATDAKRERFAQEVAEAATSKHEPAPWKSAVRCIARVGRRVCRARVHVTHFSAGRVGWSCQSCGAYGEVRGFEGSLYDMSPFVPKGGKLRVWAIDDEERKVLREAAALMPEVRAVVARGTPAVDLDAALMIQATMAELDELYTLVESLEDMTRSRARLELLRGLRMGLSTAIDGF